MKIYNGMLGECDGEMAPGMDQKANCAILIMQIINQSSQGNTVSDV